MLKPHEIQKLRSMLVKEDERMPIIFGALSDQKRCTIFRMLLEKERLCVSDISRLLKISMSLASQHLKILEITGLVTREREGRTVYFAPNTKDTLVQAISKAVQ